MKKLIFFNVKLLKKGYFELLNCLKFYVLIVARYVFKYYEFKVDMSTSSCVTAV